jgi:nicotinamide-nucleotide amidase
VHSAIVVTGSELIRGDRHDRNGPFLAQSLVRLGLEPDELLIVGDEPGALAEALTAGLRHELLVVTGGLGPTHDDRTVELLAAAAGVPLELDTALQAQIEALSRAFAERARRPYADFEAGVRKQATIPRGARIVGLAGTAPALLLETGGCVAVTLPGPPRELQELWPRVVELEPFRRLLEQVAPRSRRVLRLYGVGESAVAQELARAGGERDGVEVTICARDFEIHVDLLVTPGAEPAADELEQAFSAPLRAYLFTRDERSIEELLLDACRTAGLTLATAESCTGGLVAAALTAVPGASEVFLGATVAYANAAKETQLGVPAELLNRFGAVSAEVAEAMAEGARQRFAADVAVAVTGVAGPGGGTPEKPVGLVHLCAAGPDGKLDAALQLPGDRETVRGRATVAALHLAHRLVAKR